MRTDVISVQVASSSTNRGIRCGNLNNRFHAFLSNNLLNNTLKCRSLVPTAYFAIGHTFQYVVESGTNQETYYFRKYFDSVMSRMIARETFTVSVLDTVHSLIQ